MQELFPIKRCVQTDVVLLVMELLTGEAVRSIEAAKHLIAQPSQVDPELLAKVVGDPGYKPWSKIASAYVLGFIPLEATSKDQQVLRETLANARSSVRLRTHAAEALGNLKHEGSAALAALRKFGSTKPHGTLAQELELVGIALS